MKQRMVMTLTCTKSPKESSGSRGTYVQCGTHMGDMTNAFIFYYSPHPYIFFNKDRISITFVGFTVTAQGDLLNPSNHQVLEHAIMNHQLYTGLLCNKVNFQDDYRCWTKPIMIHKISTVMGVEFPHDPDESYVLTVDNVIKILAIQMRFRYVHKVS